MEVVINRIGGGVLATRFRAPGEREDYIIFEGGYFKSEEVQVFLFESELREIWASYQRLLKEEQARPMHTPHLSA